MDDLTGTFRFECEECDLAADHEKLPHAFSDAQHHRRAKQHAIRWETITFDLPLAVALGPEWAIECAESYRTWQRDTESEAEAFADRHEELVGYQPDQIRARKQTALDTDSVESLVRQLSQSFDRGVPRPILLGVLEPEGYDRSAIDRQLRRLSKRGDLFQPKPRQYRYITDG